MPRGGIGAKWGAAVSGSAPSRGQAGYGSSSKSVVRGYARSKPAKKTTLASGVHGRKPTSPPPPGTTTPVRPPGRTDGMSMARKALTLGGEQNVKAVKKFMAATGPKPTQPKTGKTPVRNPRDTYDLATPEERKKWAAGATPARSRIQPKTGKSAAAHQDIYKVGMNPARDAARAKDPNAMKRDAEAKARAAKRAKTGTSRIQPIGKTYAAKKGMKVSGAYGRKPR